MTDFLYDRMSRGMRRAVLFILAFAYLSIAGAIIYVAAHFAAKFW